MVCPLLRHSNSYSHKLIFLRCIITQVNRRVARIWKRGGAFLKEWEKCKRPWPEFSLCLNQNHTVCPKIETEFLGELGNSKVFSVQKQVVSKKKKVFTEIETDFLAKIGNSNAFSGRITTCTSQLRHPISFGGAVFNFSPKLGLKSTKNVQFCILHKPMGRLEPPPPPPPPSWLRYCKLTFYRFYPLFINMILWRNFWKLRHATAYLALPFPVERTSFPLHLLMCSMTQ